MLLTVDFIRNVIPECTILFNVDATLDSFSIDTRTLQKGDFFIALSGARVDGHDFLAQALSKGASGLIIEQGKQHVLTALDAQALKKVMVIVVPDTRKTLLAVAAAWRKTFTGKVIGITGSIGKTSTKQIISNILSLQKSVYFVSSGNHNTILGVALALLHVKEKHEIVILELGISRRGEMAALVELARPSIAVVTGIGHSHMEGLGSIIDIAAEKRDIFKLFKEDSIGIVNGDQPLLAHCAYSHPVIKFGAKTTNQVQARKISVDGDTIMFVLKLYGQKYKVTLKSSHKGAVFNALAAISVAYLLNISPEIIMQGIEMPVLVTGRFEQLALKTGKGMMINDCYNASPESMKASLAAFQEMQTKAQKIAVLGDMLELGVNSPFWHRQLGRFLRKVPTLRQIILVGSLVEWTKKTIPLGVKVDIVPTWNDAVEKLKDKLSQESVVLVKGSNGVGLTNLVTMFT